MSNPTTAPSITVEQLQTKVEVYDKAKDAIAEALGDNPNSALQLHVNGQKQDAYITLEEGEVWGVAEHDNGKLIEGPLSRENLGGGLESAQGLSIIPEDAAPFEHQLRGI